MSDGIQATDERASAAALVTDLERAATAHDEARKRVEEAGEQRLQELQDYFEELHALFDRYEERATGDGDFTVFIEFQEKIAQFVGNLPSDLDFRDRFEEVDEILHQRRLTESDFQQARDALSPVADLLERLDERERTRKRFSEVRHDVAARKRELQAHIEDLEALQQLGEADLDAPIVEIREPIESYNQAVRAAFETYKRDQSAREVLDFLETTEAYPLVEYRTPPDDLAAYITDSEPGTEPVPTLLEYAEYTVSKLQHYVPDARELKRNVATHQTYLRRLDASPLQIAWPPPPAGVLRFRCRELIAVVDRIAPEETIVALRRVRALPATTDYERLRESAKARQQLDQSERERLQRGAVAEELSTARAAHETLAEALESYPER